MEDFSTVISIAPVLIDQFKPGIFPGNYRIQPCLDENKPELLYVTTATHIVQLMDERPALRVDTPSWEVARSIVQDFFDSQMFTDNETGARPGVAWLQGKLSLSTILSTQSALLKELREGQHKWYRKIVQETDNDWNRYHNYRVANAVSRFAARSLDLEREWMIDTFEEAKLGHCPACHSVVPNEAVVCATCRYVLNKEKYKTMQFA